MQYFLGSSSFTPCYCRCTLEDLHSPPYRADEPYGPSHIFYFFRSFIIIIIIIIIFLFFFLLLAFSLADAMDRFLLICFLLLTPLLFSASPLPRLLRS